MKLYINCIVFISLLFLLNPLSVSANSVTLYAAGSLKAALSDVATSYEKIYNIKVTTKFGPSGLLRKAIEEGEMADIFASADMTHPQKLEAGRWGGPVVLFARNQLCILAQPGVEVTTGNLLSTLLNEKIRVGTSTPKADPSGDYAWELFKKADKIKDGSFAILSTRALQLTGGPDSEKAPEGRNPYGWVMSERKADVFLTYCTNAVLAQKEVPALKIVKINDALSVGADYGLIVRKGAPEKASQLAKYILSPDGQKILGNYGFQTIAAQAETKSLMMATTTSTEDTGLLDYLMPLFEKDTGIALKWTATGTGKALKLGETCDVDVLLVHAPSAEKKFIESGFGKDRKEVMYNDFVIIGPEKDPAGIKGKNLADALTAVKGKQALFMSRGDDSGTHKTEQELWKTSGIQLPDKETWYVSTGQGMLTTIMIAQEKNGYTLTDRGTYIKYNSQNKGNAALKILVEGDKNLLNQYSVLTLDPVKCPKAKYDLALDFSNWMASPKAQKLIRDFLLMGEQLFFPNAK